MSRRCPIAAVLTSIAFDRLSHPPEHCLHARLGQVGVRDLTTADGPTPRLHNAGQRGRRALASSSRTDEPSYGLGCRESLSSRAQSVFASVGRRPSTRTERSNTDDGRGIRTIRGRGWQHWYRTVDISLGKSFALPRDGWSSRERYSIGQLGESLRVPGNAEPAWLRRSERRLRSAAGTARSQVPVLIGFRRPSRCGRPSWRPVANSQSVQESSVTRIGPQRVPEMARAQARELGHRPPVPLQPDERRVLSRAWCASLRRDFSFAASAVVS